jgi:UrcA family protein
MFRTFTTAAILALTITAAQAANDVTVHFGDLDLTKASDAQVLTDRVHVAAASACALQSNDPRPVSLYYRATSDSCIAHISQTISWLIIARSGQYMSFASK